MAAAPLTALATEMVPAENGLLIPTKATLACSFSSIVTVTGGAMRSAPPLLVSVTVHTAPIGSPVTGSDCDGRADSRSLHDHCR